MMKGVKLALSLLLLSGICNAKPQTYGGSGDVGTGGDVTATGCQAYTHDCVPYYQCIDGEINTSGAGLIDVRIKPQTECTNTDYPTVPGICCRIPGATPPPTPAPLVTCRGGLVCVEQGQCNSDGTVNTDGTGLIDTRIYVRCVFDPNTYATGVCCQPPTPAPRQTCPGNQVCLSTAECIGGIGVGTGTGYDSCYLDQFNYAIGTGVCCDPPTPPPLVKCNGNQVCLSAAECSGGIGAVGTGGAYTSCYLDQFNYAIGTGVCCDPPTPPPLVKCNGNQVCLSAAECSGGVDVVSTIVGGYDSCYLDQANYVTGVCCDPPITVYDVCPGDSVCLPEILCQGEILDTSNSYVPYGNAGTWSLCAMSGDLQVQGVCCRNPVITPAPPLVTCPNYQVCVGEAQCAGVGAVGTATYNSCYLDQFNYGVGTGVCCDPVVTPAPLPTATKCGIRNYGLDVRTQVKLAKNEAQFGEFPWQAVLFFSNYTFKCGASLVEDRWLITGAHCVNGYQYGDFKIRLGEWQVDRYDEPLKYIDVDIASITQHPQFNPTNLHNDVAVIELTAPVPFQYHINTVCLPSLGQFPSPGTRCFATGWGKDAFEGNYQAILKKVDVPVVEYSYCQDLLRKTRLGKYFQLDKSFMCAGGEENLDACTGDGGGPLVCEDPASGQYFVQGITAWGINCGQKDVPGVYCDVQYFRDWIGNIIYGAAEVNQPGNAYGRK